MRRYSLAHLTVAELDPLDVVQCAKDTGYDFADLRLIGVVATDRHYPVFGDTPMRRDLIRRLDDTGMRIFDIELIKIVEDTRASQFEALLETAAAIGASRVKAAAYCADMSYVADVLADLCRLAAPYGLVIDLEFMPFSNVKTATAAQALVRRAGAKNIGVLVDALHLSRSGGSVAEVRGLDASLLGYMHLCDAPVAIPPTLAAIIEEARLGRMFPGEGGLPLVELIAALPQDLTVSIELPMKHLVASVPPLERARHARLAAAKVVSQADALRIAQDSLAIPS